MNYILNLVAIHNKMYKLPWFVSELRLKKNGKSSTFDRSHSSNCMLSPLSCIQLFLGKLFLLRGPN